MRNPPTIIKAAKIITAGATIAAISTSLSSVIAGSETQSITADDDLSMKATSEAVYANGSPDIVTKSTDSMIAT